MSDEQEDADLEKMRQLLEQQEAQEKARAATATAEPEPVAPPTPPVEAQAQTPEVSTPEPVAPTPTPETPAVDPDLEWASKKGLTSPEAIARSLRNMEDEFHRRNQNGHPGYKDLNGSQNPPPVPQMPPQNWNPTPQMPPYGYPPAPGYGYPPPPNPQHIAQQLSRETGIDAEDIERMLPLVVKVSSAVSARDRAAMEREVADIRRKASQSETVMRLSQDRAFVEPAVQREIHAVLEANPDLFRRSDAYEIAFDQAVKNLYRKQLQQGTAPENTNRPPVTAGRGNGSANTAPMQITEAVFNTWSDAEQDAYMKSGGRILPKR